MFLGIRKFDAKLIEMASINIQERRIEGATFSEGRHQCQLFERDDRASLHPSARPDLCATTQDDCAALHLQPHKVACSATNHDQSPSHSHPDFDAGIPINQNRSTPHPDHASTIRRSNLLSGISVNVNLAVFHLTTYPVTGIAVNFDGTTTHHGPQMHPDITMNGN